MSRISAADLHEYVAMRKNKGLANRTVNLEINALRCVFNYADELGMLQANPMGRVKNLRETTKIDHWIPSPEELARFVAEAEKTYSGPVLAAWIWTMAYTGMRPSEALFLEWQDIDFDTGRILIKPRPGNPLPGARATPAADRFLWCERRKQSGPTVRRAGWISIPPSFENVAYTTCPLNTAFFRLLLDSRKYYSSKYCYCRVNNT